MGECGHGKTEKPENNFLIDYVLQQKCSFTHKLSVTTE